MLNFDLESDGLLDKGTKVHCITVGKVGSSGDPLLIAYPPEKVPDGINRLMEALAAGEEISGHNVIMFDIPFLEKTTGFRLKRSQRRQVKDSLVLGRLIYTDLANMDMPLLRRGVLPKKLYKSHKLEAYGYRLGKRKGEFVGEVAEDDTDSTSKWAVYVPEMLSYNEQDVVVGTALMENLLNHGYSQEAIELEHDLQWLLAQMERNGFPFDVQQAEELECTLRAREADLRRKLEELVPPIPAPDFIPKRNNAKKGYITGVPVKRFKPFNPNSRQQVNWIMTTHYNYRPVDTDLYNIDKDTQREFDGNTLEVMCQAGKFNLKVDADTFTYMKTDEDCPTDLLPLVDTFEEYFTITKRLGQLVDGKQGWLKCVKDSGRIHGRINSMGCVTSRASHTSPNIAQVPKVGSPYGKECRSLFGVPKGWYQVGVDASGLELRCLAHYMYPYDNGEYAHEVVHGDVHTKNQQAAGLPTRDNAKTFIYGFLYGAGDAKIGKIVKGTKADGKRLKEAFLKQTPGIMLLRQAIQNELVAEMFRGRVKSWKRKWLRGLDGRRIPIRHLHAALNSLLQSCGALICKWWLVETERMLVEEHGLTHGWDGDFAMMAWVHDEFQAAARTKEIAELIIQVAQEAMRRTQAHFKFNVQLDTEGKIGKNWAECH
nr:DNA polymerase [uncultured Anaeromusa sp.]